MRRVLSLFLPLLFLCTGCGQTTPTDPTVPPSLSSAQDTPEEDRVLLSLEAPLADGRSLTLEAMGRVLEEHSCGVREVRVYDGETLLQTVSAREAITSVWLDGMTEDFYDYTKCWTPEQTMEVLDLNFDGNTDFGLFGWSPNNTIPYYYWTWDDDAGQFRYAFLLQGAEVRPETRELVSGYNSGLPGIHFQYDYYRPDDTGNLLLSRREREVYDFPNLDVNRESALETWVPGEGVSIRPGEEIRQDDLVLTRREIPVYEIHEDNTVSHFTEIWELQDGELCLTSREEFFYE